MSQADLLAAVFCVLPAFWLFDAVRLFTRGEFIGGFVHIAAALAVLMIGNAIITAVYP